MAVPQVPGDINQEDLINSVNNVVRELNNKEQVQVFKDEAGTRRVILDKDGLRTSAEGVDVFTATNDQLTFNSNNNVFKVVASGSLTHEGVSIASGSTDTVTIPHDLGFIPAFIVYATSPSFLGFGAGLSNLPILYVIGGSTAINLYASADDTNLYLNFLNPSAGTQDLTTLSWQFKYYIFQETAN